MEVSNLFMLNESLSQVFTSLHRLYRVGDQYVTAYASVSPSTLNTFDIDVAILGGPAQRIELITQAEPEALIKYAEVRRLILDWNGDMNAYPLPPSDVGEDDEFYNFGDDDNDSR